MTDSEWELVVAREGVIAAARNACRSKLDKKFDAVMRLEAAVATLDRLERGETL